MRDVTDMLGVDNTYAVLVSRAGATNIWSLTRSLKLHEYIEEFINLHNIEVCYSYLYYVDVSTFIILNIVQISSYYWSGNADPHFGDTNKSWTSRVHDWRTNPTMFKQGSSDFLVDIITSPFMSYIPFTRYA